ncbi:MAG: phytanoyl-CoA dioxygenase family protein [Planctomycetaceae bacterium]|nr:phytanoyl-CoA dioxygenase family protein [Planctomycetaceae bacterium]
MSVGDLSRAHHPLSRLFSEISEGASLRLTDAQVEHYREFGYVSGIQVFTNEQCDAICEELAELVNPDHEGRSLWYEYNSNESADPTHVLFHALGAWRLRTALHDCLFNPRMLIPASQLLEGNVRFWHDQLFCKPARHGGVVAWHQDYSYWTRTQPMAHLTCWIGLDKATADNGCLQYIPGSHHWELLPITGLAGDMDAIRTVLTEEQQATFAKPVAIPLERGYASFHHPLLIHGSYANHTDGPRRAVVINMVRDGVTSASREPLLEGVPPVPPGQPLSGQFFPLLWEN